MSSLHQRCICQICNCGRHKCPHKPHRPTGVCHLSEYQRTFTGERMTPVAGFKPKVSVPADSSGCLGMSTQQTDFKPHSLQARRPKTVEHYKPGPPFRGGTEYESEFPNHGSGHAAKPFQPKHRRRATEPLAESTEQTDRFVAWRAKPPTRHKEQRRYEVNPAEMDLETTAGAAFVKHNTAPADSCKPAQVAARPSSAAYRTTHATDFSVKDLPKRLCRSAEKYRPPRHPFNTISTAQDDFRQFNNFEPVKSCRPHPAGPQRSLAFDGQTTHQAAFQAWQQAPPVIKAQAAYVPPGGDLQKSTTNRSDFVQHDHYQANIAPPPRSRMRTRSAPMASETTHNAAFKRWKVDPNRPLVIHERVEPAAFQGESEFQSNFNAKEYAKQRSFKPYDYAKEQLPFEARTSYQSDYHEKPMPVCPAVEVHALPPTIAPGTTTALGNLMYSHATSSGHRVFVPLQRDDTHTGAMALQPMIALP